MFLNLSKNYINTESYNQLDTYDLFMYKEIFNNVITIDFTFVVSIAIKLGYVF